MAALTIPGGTLPRDTIVAVASAPGTAAVGVVRLSGPLAPSLLARLYRPAREPGAFESHRLYAGWIADPGTGEKIDQVLAVRFRAPRSYTGEEAAEIHAHGSDAVLRRIVRLALAAGARPARPGEFTERAFLAGKIDLAQAESVADLIAARSERARRQALEVLRGTLSARVREIAEKLRGLLAHVELDVDFSETEEVDAPQAAQLAARARSLEEELLRLAATYRQGRLVREGARVAIVGAPNAGKSSLFNALLQEERALVHEEPGTTRDRIEEWCEVEGIAVRLADTAGLREAAGVEAAGVALSRRAIEEADLLLLVADGTRPLSEETRALRAEASGRVLLAATKSDLPGFRPQEGALPLSARTGEGVGALRAAIARRLAAGAGSEEGVVLTRERHRDCVRAAAEAVGRAAGLLPRGDAPELAASALRAALAHLSEIAGATASEDILGLIFSEFCIGK